MVGAGVLAVVAVIAAIAAAGRWAHITIFRFDPTSGPLWEHIAQGLSDGTLALRSWVAWAWAMSFPLLVALAAVAAWAAWRRSATLAIGLRALVTALVSGARRRRVSKPRRDPIELSTARPPELGLGSKARERGQDQAAPAELTSTPLPPPPLPTPQPQPADVLQAACLDVSGIVGPITAGEVEALLAAQGVSLDTPPLATLQADVARAGGEEAPVAVHPHSDQAPRGIPDPEAPAEMEGAGAWDEEWDMPPAAATADLPPGWDEEDDAGDGYDYEYEAGDVEASDVEAGGEAPASGRRWDAVAAAAPAALPTRRSLLLAYSRYTRDGWTVVGRPTLDGLEDACDLVLCDSRRLVLVILYDRPVRVTATSAGGSSPAATWGADLAPTIRALAARESALREIGGALDTAGLAVSAVVVVGATTNLETNTAERTAWDQVGVSVLTHGRDVDPADGSAPAVISALLSACGSPLP